MPGGGRSKTIGDPLRCAPFCRRLRFCTSKTITRSDVKAIDWYAHNIAHCSKLTLKTKQKTKQKKCFAITHAVYRDETRRAKTTVGFYFRPGVVLSPRDVRVFSPSRLRPRPVTAVTRRDRLPRGSPLSSPFSLRKTAVLFAFDRGGNKTTLLIVFEQSLLRVLSERAPRVCVCVHKRKPIDYDGADAG